LHPRRREGSAPAGGPRGGCGAASEPARERRAAAEPRALASWFRRPRPREGEALQDVHRGQRGARREDADGQAFSASARASSKPQSMRLCRQRTAVSWALPARSRAGSPRAASGEDEEAVGEVPLGSMMRAGLPPGRPPRGGPPGARSSGAGHADDHGVGGEAVGGEAGRTGISGRRPEPVQRPDKTRRHRKPPTIKFTTPPPGGLPPCGAGPGGYTSAGESSAPGGNPCSKVRTIPTPTGASPRT